MDDLSHNVPTSPAGWYPDPSGVPGQMYWDGQRWRNPVSAPPPPAAPWDQVRPQLDKGRHFWSGLSSGHKVILALAGVLVVVAVIAVPVAVFGGSGGGGSSGTPAQSDSYRQGFEDGSKKVGANSGDASTLCNIDSGLAHDLDTSVDEAQYTSGCVDAIDQKG